MNNFIETIKDEFRNSFKTQDSKFFIFTAFKITIVPLFSFGVVFYSFWTIMEMNFNFFAANGFLTGEDNKATFYDNVLLNITDYFMYFGAIVSAVFLVGLLTSYFALRSFSKIADFVDDMENDIDSEFIVKGLNQNKLINQVGKIFFKYLQVYAKTKKKPKFKLPKSLELMSSPPTDKVFLLQYISIVGIICMVTNIAIYSFTHELYQEIVAAGIKLLPGNQVVSSFLVAQEGILFNVYAIAIIINVAAYLSISKGILKTVDGVCYGFARDLLQIINGDHSMRLRPRLADPGKDLARKVNEFLDEVFYEDHLTVNTLDNHQELSIASFDEIEEDQDDSFESESFDSPKELSVEFFSEDEDELDLFEDKEDDELPPAFIEEKQVANGEKVFQVTTPNGMKLDGLNEELVLKLVTEIENKKTK